MTARAEPSTVPRCTPVPLPPGDCPVVGVSPAIRRAIGLALRFAPTELPILLVGPTGSGKELFARQIHTWSGRRGALVDVNAGALPREMVESLLFGHRRGAFTGATVEARGLIAAADQGTLFLDELASLPVEGQAKLLRAIESGEVRPLGGTAKRRVRCRFIAAVQEDLDERIRSGAFRADLYQRLAGVVIRLPALAERPEDVVPLAREFAAAADHFFDLDAESELQAYAWPGNARELKVAVHRAGFLGTTEVIVGEAMREAIELGTIGPSGAPLRVGEGAHVHALVDLCRSHAWDVQRAAAALGVGRATLYRRLRGAGIDPSLWRMVHWAEVAGPPM